MSDLICLEHQLSVIEKKPYRERQKRTLYPPRESNRDKLCAVIDGILPKVKELDAEYSNLLTEKKARYPDYRKAKEEMQELLRAKRNVELFFAEEKSSAEKTKSR